MNVRETTYLQAKGAAMKREALPIEDQGPTPQLIHHGSRMFEVTPEPREKLTPTAVNERILEIVGAEAQ